MLNKARNLPSAEILYQ